MRYNLLSFLMVVFVAILPQRAQAACGFMDSFGMQAAFLAMDVGCLGQCGDVKDTLENVCDQMEIIAMGFQQFEALGTITNPALLGTTHTEYYNIWYGFHIKITQDIQTMGQAINAEVAQIGVLAQQVESLAQSAGQTSQSDGDATFSQIQALVAQMSGHANNAENEAGNLNDRVRGTTYEFCGWASTC